MSNFILWSKTRSNKADGASVETLWCHKPTVNEVTRVTHDPQMSIALLRGSCVTVGDNTFSLEEHINE